MNHVIPGSGIDIISAATAFDHVITVTTDNGIISGTTGYLVVTGSAVQNRIARPGVNNEVITVLTIYFNISVAGGLQVIRSVTAVERDIPGSIGDKNVITAAAVKFNGHQDAFFHQYVVYAVSTACRNLGYMLIGISASHSGDFDGGVIPGSRNLFYNIRLVKSIVGQIPILSPVTHIQHQFMGRDGLSGDSGT